MPDDRRVLRAAPADYREQRNERHLLVWGELAHWMVVDAGVVEFLGLFDGRRTVSEAIREYSLRRNQPVAVAAASARPVIADLIGRGILYAGPAPAAADDPVSLANITINLTNRCNLSCRWCYNIRRQTKEMDIELLMDNLAASRPVIAADATLIVLGGEPLLELEQLLALLRRAPEVFRARTLFSTNGTLLTEESAERLAKHHVEVQVSLDSPVAEHHDAVRGGGSFERAVAGIRHLVRARIPTMLNMVYTNQNLDEFREYFELGRQLGVDEVRFIPLRLIGQGTDCAGMVPDQVRAFETLMEILDRHPQYRPLLKRDFFSIMMAVCRHSLRRVNCGIGYRVAFIDADGTVYPCPNHVVPELACGSLSKERLRDIVERSPGFATIREQYRVARYPGCRRCPFRNWCAGDCRGEVVAMTGTVGGPAPHCGEYRKLYPRLFWLASENDPRFGGQTDHGAGKTLSQTYSV